MVVQVEAFAEFVEGFRISLEVLQRKDCFRVWQVVGIPALTLIPAPVKRTIFLNFSFFNPSTNFS